jgi:serine/threonine-protein kinase
VGYECLTGRSAFSGDNAVTVALKQLREQPRPLPAELPAGVRELILRALAKDPAGRFRDGTAFLAAIDDVASGRPLSGSSVPRAIPLPPAAGAGWAGGSAPDARESFPTVGPPTLGPPTVAAAVGPATGRSARTPPGRLRPRLGRAVLPAVALLAGAGIAAAVVPRMVAAPAPAGNAVVAAPTQPAGYVLVPGDYVGRPVEEVAIQLAALGLSPQRRPQATDDAPPGTVTAVSPTGVAVHPGDAVVLTYAVAGSGAGDGPADGSGPSSGTGLVPAAQTSVAPRPVPGPAPGPAGGSSLPAAASTSSEGAVAAASVAPQSPNDAAPTSSATATPSASGTSSPAATSSATSTPTLPRPSSASPSGSSTG